MEKMKYFILLIVLKQATSQSSWPIFDGTGRVIYSAPQSFREKDKVIK